MTKQPPEAQQGGRQASEATFTDLKKEIAERNEQAHKEAREIRARRELEQLGIVARHRLDLDR
jgi:molybdenum-dependent DNA-binding transcriptional regulator ModE